MAPFAASSELDALPRLTDLRSGETARLREADLRDKDLELLNALGMSVQSPFRLCKAGDPWIVQVRGTRIGISDHVARLLRVEPDAAAEESLPDDGSCAEGAADEVIGGERSPSE